MKSSAGSRLSGSLRYIGWNFSRRPRGIWDILNQSMLWFAVLAVLVGIIAGFGAVAFRLLIGFFHNLFFFGHFSAAYDANVHTMPSTWGLFLILAPIVGAIVVAFLVKNFAPEAKGHGVPEVMDAIYYNRGVIRPVVAVIKSIASALSIGTGGSIGREGPIIQIGSAFGSTVGQVLPVPEWQRMALIGCGAAGGIAATFNTPIGGVLFAIELIVPEISVRTLVPLVLATGSATFISRIFLGNHPAFYIPALALTSQSMTSAGTMGAYAIFGIFLGLLSVLFIRSIYAFEDWFNRIPANYYIRHGLGMALVGITMYLMMHMTGHYYIEGVGYATVQDILTNQLTVPWFLLLLVALKLVMTSLTLGSGGSGGIFSPSLFMGATFGGAFAWIANHLFPALHLDPVSTGVIGMAGVVGGATGAAVTAIVMIFEMTRDYAVIIPLLISVSIAYGVRRAIMEASIYDMKLRRRGHLIPNVLQTNLYLLERARDRITQPILRIGIEPNIERLRRLLSRLNRTPHLVVTAGGRVHAVIPSAIVRDMTLVGDELKAFIEQRKGQRYIVVAADDMLFDIIARLRDCGCELALVTESGEMNSADEIRGILTLADVIQGTQLPQLLLGEDQRFAKRGSGNAPKTAYREGDEKRDKTLEGKKKAVP